MVLARFRDWLRRQDPEHQALYCEHASYVGFNRSLAYMCESCPET